MAVLGGGAAGLSVVCHLAAAGWTGRLVVVDDGVRPVARRSWAYWSAGDLLLDAVATPGVDHLAVRGPTLDRVLALERHRYRVMTGAALEAAVHDLRGPGLEVDLVRATATSVRAAGDHALVMLDPHDPYASPVLRARWVLDSVGPSGSGSAPTSIPHLDFVGHHVRTPTDVFDPSTPVLMDFPTDQSAGLRFVYVLPTSPREALVESTRFVVPSPGHELPPARHADTVTAYVDALAGSHEVTGSEEGVIALHTDPPPRARGPVVPIGARAGLVRASTGYGWSHIQRHSAALAASLVRHGHPHDVPGPDRWHAGLDALLLDVVRDEPAAVVDVLEALFARNDPDRVVDFLERRSGPLAELGLFVTLPVRPYARAAARRLWRSARRRSRGMRD